MRLNQITAPALDMEKSVEFYKILGLNLIVQDSFYCRFEVGDGTETFSLHLTNNINGAFHGPHIYFECNDLDARVADLKSKGIIFDSGPVDQTWLWREAWLTDPAGVKICLYYAGENRRFPPWRINSKLPIG